MSSTELIRELKRRVEQLPSLDALQNEINRVKRKTNLISSGVPQSKIDKFEPDCYNLFESFDRPQIEISNESFDFEHLRHYLEGTPMFDQACAGVNGLIVEEDGVFCDYMGFAWERLSILSKIRHGEIVHRGLYYEERVPEFTLLPLEDLLSRLLNPLFEIDNELMADERAYLQKIQSRCQSRLGDIRAYMRFNQFYPEVSESRIDDSDKRDLQNRSSKDAVSGDMDEEMCSKVRASVAKLYEVNVERQYQDIGICSQVLRKVVENFTGMTNMLDEVNNEDVFGLKLLELCEVDDPVPADLQFIQDKLISGQEINGEPSFPIDELQDSSLEFQAQFRRKCIYSATQIVDFEFLNTIAHEKTSNAIEAAADLLIRTREAELRLQLLETINEVFWFISTAVFCSGPDAQPLVVHSPGEFHCMYEGKELLLSDSEIELERQLNTIQHADEQEFLFELEQRCENFLGVKEVVEELFFLLCRSDGCKSEIIVLMCQIARANACIFNKNAASFLEEAAKYIALDERRFKYPNYSRISVFRSFAHIIEEYDDLLEYDIKKQFLLASLFESARLELFYVYNFKLQTSEPLNCLKSVAIQQRLFGIIGLLQSAQGALREIGSEVSSGSGDSKPAVLGEIETVGDLPFYNAMLCFREFGNSRFLENFDCHELVKGDCVLELLALGQQQADLGGEAEREILVYLDTYHRFLLAKLEFLLESNITPFREINIRAQRGIFAIIIEKYDYFSGQIDEIVSANLPITTSSVFLTQREKCNIPELLVDYVYLLAFCQFIWSQEQYYKERQLMIQNFSLVEVAGSSQFCGLEVAQMENETRGYEHRNRLLSILVKYGRENAFEPLEELIIEKLFYSEGIHPPSPQEIAAMPLDSFDDVIVFALMEWWQGIAFCARFKNYLTREHALFPYRPLELVTTPSNESISIATQDPDIICDQLQNAVEEEISCESAMLKERLQMIKTDSNKSTYKIDDFYDFIQDELGHLLGSAFDFETEAGLASLCTALRYLKYLRHALFEEYVQESQLKLTEMREYGLYWFNSRQRLSPVEGVGRLQCLIDEIEDIRVGKDKGLQDSHAPIQLVNGVIYHEDNLRKHLCEAWFRFAGLQHGNSLEEDLQLFHQRQLEKELFADKIRYQETVLQHKEKHAERRVPAPLYSTPLPGITGVSDLESTQILEQKYEQLEFMKRYPTRNFYWRLARSCQADGLQHDYGLISNWAYAMIKRQFLRDIAHFVKHSRFYMMRKSSQGQLDEAAGYMLEIPSEEVASLIHICAKHMRREESCLETQLAAQRASLEANSRAEAERSLHHLEIRIWNLSWLSEACSGQLQLQREQLETLLGRFYEEPIRTLQIKLIMAEERLESFKDAMAEKVRHFVAERRVSGLMSMADKVHSQLFLQIAALDQDLEKVEDLLLEHEQRLRKMQTFDEIQRLPVIGEISGLSSLEKAEERRAETIVFYLKEIIQEKEAIAEEQVAELQNELSRICARADETQEMANARASKKQNFIETLASKIAVPEKLEFDAEEIQNRCAHTEACNEELKMQLQDAKQKIVECAADQEKLAKHDKRDIVQLKERKAALTQHIEALQSAKEMLLNGIEGNIRQSEQDTQESVAELGRKLQEERVKCRAAETEYKATKKIVDQFEEEAARRQNGLFL